MRSAAGILSTARQTLRCGLAPFNLLAHISHRGSQGFDLLLLLRKLRLKLTAVFFEPAVFRKEHRKTEEQEGKAASLEATLAK